MKKVSITGAHRSGKTSALIDSIVMHIIDPDVKDDVALVVIGADRQTTSLLKTAVVAKLHRLKVKFMAYNSKIVVDKKTIRFVIPEFPTLIGIAIDYLFIDNIELMPAAFIDFIDTIMRPNVVVIQTYEDSVEIGKFHKHIPVE